MARNHLDRFGNDMASTKSMPIFMTSNQYHFIYVCVCMYVCMCVCVCMYVCMYVYVRRNVYVCVVLTHFMDKHNAKLSYL